MKRKSTLPMTQVDVEPLVKTSITIPRVLMQFAETQLTLEGFNSLSAYLSELVRRDRRDRGQGGHGGGGPVIPVPPSSPPDQSEVPPKIKTIERGQEKSARRKIQSKAVA